MIDLALDATEPVGHLAIFAAEVRAAFDEISYRFRYRVTRHSRQSRARFGREYDVHAVPKSPTPVPDAARRRDVVCCQQRGLLGRFSVSQASFAGCMVELPQPVDLGGRNRRLRVGPKRLIGEQMHRRKFSCQFFRHTWRLYQHCVDRRCNNFIHRAMSQCRCALQLRYD